MSMLDLPVEILSTLSPAELIAEVVHLRGENAQLRGENAQLRGENAQLRGENAQLRADLAAAYAQIAALTTALTEAQALLAQLQTQQQTLQRELTDLKRRPFARRHPPAQDAAETRPRGRPPGHPGSSRTRPTRIDRTERIAAPDACPDCGTPCTGDGVERDRIVEDIEITRPTVITRFIIERAWCPRCRRYHESPVTAALPHHRLGWHVLLFVVYQKVAMGLSYGKIQRELQRYFGLTVSHGELPGMVAEVSRLFGPAYARLIALMRRQKVLHIDETSWKVNGTVHWLWTFLNDVVALYVMSRSRGSRVPAALLGADFDGTIISDFFSAYSPLEVEKAKCWAHILAESHRLAKGKPPDAEGRRLHEALHGLFIEMGLALEEAEADPDRRTALAAEMRARLLTVAEQPWKDWDCKRLAERVIKYVDELLVWLVNPDVAATNNAAERGLRGAVVARKTSFGSRSKYGAQAFARMLSIITTMELQGQDFFTSAHTALSDLCSQS
jgi:transposase